MKKLDRLLAIGKNNSYSQNINITKDLIPTRQSNIVVQKHNIGERNMEIWNRKKVIKRSENIDLHQDGLLSGSLPRDSYSTVTLSVRRM